jgi:hypothetical protein
MSRPQQGKLVALVLGPPTRIIDHAYRLFCDSGYPGTTMEAIAAKAGVATQTVYYSSGPKHCCCSR